MTLRHFLIAIAALFVLLTFTLTAWLTSDSGRRFVARELARALTRTLPGRISIDRIEAVSLTRLAARGVTFEDPKGVRVLQIDHADIDADPWSALLGTLVFERARVDGGRLVIAVQPDGRTGIEATFSAPSNEPPDPERGLHFDLRNIEVHDLELVLTPARDQTFRMQHVSAALRVWRLDTAGVRLAMQNIHARVISPELLGSHVTLERTEGWVHGAETHVLSLAFNARLEDSGSIDGTLDYFSRKRLPVLVDLKPNGDLKTHLATALVDAQSWFTDAVKVEVH